MNQVTDSTVEPALSLQRRTGLQAAVVAATLLAAVLLGAPPLFGWSISSLPGSPLAALATPLLFLVPGLALLRLLWPAHEPLSITERLPLALGLSVALPPLLLLLSEPLGLRWGPAATWAYCLLCLLVAWWPQGSWQLPRVRQPSLAAWLLLAMTLIALAMRLYLIRDVPVGMWGDSYHHTMIAQLLVDNGGLFQSWEPYARLRSMTYHPGFHANVAMFHWLTGIAVSDGVLLVGQLLNAAALPLAYLLALRLGFGQQAALWSALATGFLLLMPTYYVNWGRYTQLAGHTVLVALLVCWYTLLDRERFSWRLCVLCGVVSAGLLLTHYRVVIFAACFLLAYGAYRLATIGRWSSLRVVLRSAATALAVGLALASLWLPRLLTSRSAGHALSVAQKDVRFTEMNALPTLEQLLTLYTPPLLVALAVVGSGFLVAQRRWRPLVLLPATALLWLAANPFLLGLPGTGVLTSFAVIIALYLVLAPLAAYGCGQLSALLVPAAYAPALLVLGISGGIAWGLTAQRSIPDQQFMLFTPADAAAMDWVRAETPPDSRFLVNSFFAFGGGVAVGSDGGWWIPLLTGRATTLPPATYGTEYGPTPDYRQQVNQVITDIHEPGVLTPEGLAAMRRHGIDYIYVGAHMGQNDRIDPGQLAQTPGLVVVYEHDGVTIARLR